MSVFAGILLMFMAVSAVKADKPSDVGFSDSGYNERANLFNGTVMSWCMDKVGNQTYCDSVYGFWANDNLIMKWNNEWDRGNAEGWTDPNGYKAWLSNEYNGAFPGGSGEVWHYKIIWVGDCGADGTALPNGGYCIWGQFEVIMDQGVNVDGHQFFAHGLPTGYGAY